VCAWDGNNHCLHALPLPGFKKKLGYCWETVRRESQPKLAEIDVKNDNLG